jgi:hypothetical protein
VNDFNDPSRKLNYCVKDVQDLAQAFARNQSKVDTLVFTNSEVTKENILALKSYLQKNTTVNDKVIISCSSHGLLDDSLNFYLATYDVDFAHPEKRGLAYEDLEGLLDGIPARQKLLLLDACNSGPNEQMLIKEKTKKSIPGYKGVNVEIVNDEINTFHQMTELFVNVRNNTGSFIIAASGGMQSAQEGRVVEGKKIAPKLRMLVVPGSERVRQQAMKEGLDKVFLDFGAEWRNAGCSMCLGMNPDQLSAGERAASTSNRNFEGRQGKGGRTHLVSPLVAAATAIRGTLSSPADL